MSIKTKKRILHSFRLDEISTVDNPAQEGAVMTLLKRAKPEPDITDDGMEWINMRAAAIKDKNGGTDAAALQQARAEHLANVAAAIAHPDTPTPPDKMTKAGEEQALRALEALGKRTDELIAKYGIQPEEKEPDMSKADPNAFTKTVTDIRTRDGSSRTDALRKARRESPEAFETYQTTPPPERQQYRVDVHKQTLAKGLANATAGTFEKRVNAIKSRDGCSRQDALRKARIEHPNEFQALQSS